MTTLALTDHSSPSVILTCIVRHHTLQPLFRYPSTTSRYTPVNSTIWNSIDHLGVSSTRQLLSHLTNIDRKRWTRLLAAGDKGQTDFPNKQPLCHLNLANSSIAALLCHEHKPALFPTRLCLYFETSDNHRYFNAIIDPSLKLSAISGSCHLELSA